jgi:hypothetical protein
LRCLPPRTVVYPVERLVRIVDALVVLLSRFDDFVCDIFQRVLLCLCGGGLRLCCGMHCDLICERGLCLLEVERIED